MTTIAYAAVMAGVVVVAVVADFLVVLGLVSAFASFPTLSAFAFVFFTADLTFLATPDSFFGAAFFLGHTCMPSTRWLRSCSGFLDRLGLRGALDGWLGVHGCEDAGLGMARLRSSSLTSHIWIRRESKVFQNC